MAATGATVASAALVVGLLAAMPASATPDGGSRDGGSRDGGSQDGSTRTALSHLVRAGADERPRAARESSPSAPSEQARPGEPGIPPGGARPEAPVAPELQAPLERAAAAAKPIRRTGVVNEVHAQSSSAQPGQLLSRVNVVQNLQTGVLEAKATFRAAPTTDSFVFVWFGRWEGQGCRPGAVLAAGSTSNQTTGQFFDGAGNPGRALGVKRSRKGAVLTITSTNNAATLKTAAYECVGADVVRPGTDPVQYHQQFKWHDFDDHFPPQLSIDRGVPVQGNYRGKWTKVRLEVYNASQSAAPNVVVRPRGKGLQFKPKVRKLGKIDRRSTKYGVEFRVRLKPKKAKQRKATFVARSGGRAFQKKVTIAVKPRPTTYKSLAGRYFWGFLPAAVDKGWDNRAVWFVNRKWVHTGFAPKGNKPKCSKKNKNCKRYNYNARTGQVKIGGKRFKVNSEGFRYKVAKSDRAPARFYPTTLAKRNQRFNVRLMRHDFTGMCGLWCNTWTEWLSMDKKGRFVWSRMSISSLGPPGVGTIIGNVPPDERGTYRVQKNGKVVLKFANGKTQRHTLAVEHDVRGRPSPAGEGMVLGAKNFYLG